MTTESELIALAERVESATGPDRELDYAIFCATAIKEQANHWHPSDGNQFTASLDAAMTLGQGFPWLVPIIDYAERTVRLVNGIGLPVGGTDHLSRASGDMCCAVAAAWLRARAAAQVSA